MGLTQTYDTALAKSKRNIPKNIPMPDDDRKDHDPERGSLVDKHSFDNVMGGLLVVKPETEKKDKSRKRKRRGKNGKG